MKGIEEFKARIESDAAFKAKFANLTDIERIKLAKAEGYNFEILSDEELDAVAGGNMNEIARIPKLTPIIK